MLLHLLLIEDIIVTNIHMDIIESERNLEADLDQHRRIQTVQGQIVVIIIISREGNPRGMCVRHVDLNQIQDQEVDRVLNLVRKDINNNKMVSKK